jgi:hypothetical protein
MKSCAECVFSALCLSGKGHGRVALRERGKKGINHA